MQNDNAKFKSEFRARLYRFVLRLIKFVGTLPKNDATRVIIPQILRSGTSMLANYIEARAASSKKEFTVFFQHSLKSANETVVWLELLRDTDNGDPVENEYLRKELGEIANMFASAIMRLKGKR